MSAPVTDTLQPVPRLDRWLLRHGQELHAKAVSDVEATEALHEVVGRNAMISESQLYGLYNTAQANQVSALLEFVRERAKRRRKVDKDKEADFWEALSDKLKALGQEEAARAAEAVRAGSGDASSEEDVEERARLLVTRAYVSHLVAHCRYLNGRSAS